MRRITQEELKTILENHKHWLNQDCDGWEHMAADLSGMDLSRADLSGAELQYTNLSCADLRSADLRNANLSCADLRGADLSCANLFCAILQDADLSCASLHNAIISGAELQYVKNMPDIPYACPKTGSFIGYKKARNYIVVLGIPEDAKRSSSTGEKCRCNKARVLRIETYDGSPAYKRKVASFYDHSFIYEVGKTVEVDDFDTNRWNECAPGIHFFMNRDDAVHYHY